MNYSFKKDTMIILTIIMMLASFAVYSYASPLNVTFNSSIGGTLIDNMNNIFEQKVAELSDGAIKLQVIPNGTLGTARELVESVQINTVNLAWAADSEINQIVGGMAWAWLPGLFSTYEEADKYYNSGWIYNELEKIANKGGIAFIASAENGFRIVCANTPIDSIDDLKGMKIRVPEQKQLVKFYELMGALPCTITATESFTAMQQGTVDGSDNTLQNLNNLGFFDIAKYFTILNYQYDSAKIIGNYDWWKSLTDEQRSIISEAASLAGASYRDGIRQKERELLELGASGGVTFIYPDEDFKAAIKNVANQMWENAREEYDASYIDRIINEFAQ